MVLRGFERRLEALVEGTFSKLFRTGVSPVEIGRKLVRAMEDSRTVDVRGRPVVANHFVVKLSAEDNRRFAAALATLRHELEESVREAAREEGASFLGPVEVVLTVDPDLKRGSVKVIAELKGNQTGIPPGSLLLPDGRRFRLGSDPVIIGRSSEADLRLADLEVSRRHAQISLRRGRFVLRDLGSTNGTYLNGRRITESGLVNGDSIRLGAVELVFEES